MKPFDLYKCPRNEKGHWLCQTKDGLKVRILTDDAMGKCPLQGLILFDNAELAGCWTTEGQHNVNVALNTLDLVNTPLKITKWIGIFKRKNSHNCYVTAVKNTEEEAKSVLSSLVPTEEWELHHIHSFEIVVD